MTVLNAILVLSGIGLVAAGVLLIASKLMYVPTDERAAQYRGMDWSVEYDLAVNGDPNDTQSAL